jgi:hypothetical protein
VNVIPFSRTRFDLDKLKGRIKGPKVFVQAPIKYQPFVEEYYDGLLPDDGFLKEVSKRTGYERPEELPWVALAVYCKSIKKPVKLIEPDINKVLEKAGKKLRLEGDERRPVFQAARLWFLSGTGYMRHFYSAFDTLFFWCPWRVFWRKLFLRAVAFVVNVIPGDQQDVMALVHEANAVLADELSRLLKGLKKSTVFLDEDIAGRVEHRIAEM